VSKVDPTSTYLASGSADGVVKVWDILRGYVTHVFKGHGGVVSALAFNYPRDPSSLGRETKMQLISASVDTKIRIFDLSAAATRTAGGLKPEAVLEGHDSVPRALDVSLDGKWLISGGRDSVVLIWDLSSRRSTSKKDSVIRKGKDKAFSPTLAKTVPILERVEAVGLLHPDEDLAGSTSAANKIRFYTGGEKGVVKIWDGREGAVLFTLGEEDTKISDDHEQQRQIVGAMYVLTSCTIVVKLTLSADTFHQHLLSSHYTQTKTSFFTPCRLSL
jgi:U3 small nucleolar RNA-associated protein 13